MDIRNPDTEVNRSPAGLLEQGIVTADPGVILTASTATHVTRIHWHTPVGSINCYVEHVPGGTAVAGTQHRILRVVIADAGDVCFWEALSLGATISLARGDTLRITGAAANALEYSVYGYGSRR